MPAGSTISQTSGPQRKGGLGRGLAALIPTGPVGSAVSELAPRERHNGRLDAASGQVAGAVYQEVPIGSIVPNPKQPRQSFDEESLAELEHSIREFGLMQPIVVRPLPAEPAIGHLPAKPAISHLPAEPAIAQLHTVSYELVMGERRWRAAQQAGLDRIPAIVRCTADDAMLRDALLENIHRVQLNPLEEAAAYQQLLEDFGVTHEQLASRIGRSRPVITNTIRLLRLPVAVQRRVAVGVLSAGHARALLGLDEPFAQESLAARIVAEGLSVRATEEAVTLNRSESPPTAPKAAASRPMRAPGLQELAENLSDTFDTRVKVELGRRKGRIVVEFGSVDDLERIVALMTPPR
ncbi:MAG TPA: ParB/RepB/Spo0J family partition protein [Pseudonocardiaceae bacterium]|jgi:ParB family chromosome partitioning protein